MTSKSSKRAPIAPQTNTKAERRQAKPTEALATPIAIRHLDGGAGRRLRQWVHERLGRQLGKFGTLIERIDVRFGDINGTKGGLDRSCMVHVVLSSLPPVVVEITAATDQEAFDLAAGKAERATRRNLEKHGFSTGHKKRNRQGKPAYGDLGANGVSVGSEVAAEGDGASRGSKDGDPLVSELGDNEPLFGKRAGQGHDQLMLLQQRPEKGRRDIQVDTSKPGVGADDRKAGYGHTGKRNTKLNNAGMSYALEDSTDGKPSRKSSRGSANRSKAANGLARRTKSAVLSPKSIASRSVSRGH